MRIVKKNLKRDAADRSDPDSHLLMYQRPIFLGIMATAA
jgi:hypothetical protein